MRARLLVLPLKYTASLRYMLHCMWLAMRLLHRPMREVAAAATDTDSLSMEYMLVV